MSKFSFILSIISSLVFLACNNNADQDGLKNSVVSSNEADVSSSGNSITFKVNGELVTTAEWNISRSIMMDQMVLNITSNMHQEPRTINININGEKTGSYKFSEGPESLKNEGYAYGSYFPDYKNEMTNSFNFQDGELIITSIDTAKGILNASFAGTAKNLKGESVAITEGKVVNGKLKPGVMKY
jgi:hypothetical protein